MDNKKLEELIRLVEDSEIQELEISGPFTSVRIAKAGARPQERQPVDIEPLHPVGLSGSSTAATGADESEAADRDSGLVPIVSPMVGTFYAAPSPDAAPYVGQGDRVNKGQIVCIVEAMKLMNEIEAETSGTIVRVLVENAQPVEYGQELFLVQPD
jgi:acetyl-CoA carboxylase biotin carboxyl carrier protein